LGTEFDIKVVVEKQVVKMKGRRTGSVLCRMEDLVLEVLKLPLPLPLPENQCKTETNTSFSVSPF
jgi:hypothetical protein